MRKVPQIIQEADAVVRRLRETDATQTQIRAEYGCAHGTFMRAVLSRMTPEQWRELARRRLARGGRATRWQPGHATWNAGRKGVSYPGCRATQFQPGAIRGAAARKYKPIGSVTVRLGKRMSNQERARHRQSIRHLKVRDDGPYQTRWLPLARVLWEQAHGPVPPGYFVGHRDNDTMNDALENLILVDRRGHMRRLYERPAVIAKCRAKASSAARRRHRENRAGKDFVLRERRRTRVAWECPACGADYDAPVPVCGKCGSASITGVTIKPMSESNRVNGQAES